LKSGSYGFDGNVVNVVQNIEPLMTECLLPRPLNELSVLIVRRSTGADPSDFTDFKVSARKLKQWIEFLQAHNKFYARVGVNNTVLSSLPSEGDGQSVYRSLNVLNPPTTGEDSSDEEEPEVPTTAGISGFVDATGEEEDEVYFTGGGYEEGPVHVEAPPEGDNVLTTGIGDVINGVQQMEEIQNAFNYHGVMVDEDVEEDTEQQQQDGAFPYPEAGTVPLPEHSTPGLFAKSFPHLFPFGVGDPTDGFRRTSISLSEAATHFSRYGIPNGRGGYDCPFDRDPRFSHYFQDVDERLRSLKQASFYLTSNPEDALKSIEEIRGLSPQEIIGLCNRIQRYSANICGSNSFFRLRRRELQALIEQKGHPTLWFTLSYADHHWKDLLQKLGTPPDEAQTDEAKHKWYCKQANEHPAINGCGFDLSGKCVALFMCMV